MWYLIVSIPDLAPLLTFTKHTFPFSLKLCILLLLDFSLTVKAATLIFISGRGSAFLSANEGKSGLIYNLV